AVVLTGCICTNGGQLLVDLGKTLGPQIPFLATDNFTFSGDMAQPRAPPAAFRTYVTGALALPQGLPPPGRAPVPQVFPGRPLKDISRTVPAAAASMGLLLDAIAHSDGTRASVVDQLIHSRAVGTPLGSFAFDANGDPTLAPVTVTRISKSAG